MRKVLFINFAGLGNLGDDLLLSSAISLHGCENVYFYNGTRDLVLSRELELTVNGLNTFVFIDRLSFLKRAISTDVDKVIIAGGQVFQDFRNPFKSMSSVIFRAALLCKYYNTQFFIERVGISTLSSLLSRSMLSVILRVASDISVRDKYSKDFVDKNFPKYSSSVTIKKDFVLESFSEYYNSLSSINITEPLGKVAICLCGDVSRVEKQILSTFSRVDYYSMVDATDIGVDRVLLSPLSFCKIVSILRGNSTVITNRLHFAILSHLAKVPNIYILSRDSNKLKAFSDEYAYPMLDYNNLDVNDTIFLEKNNS